MKKCFAVAISILIILMSCSEHKKVEKVLTWEDSVDMALKGYVYLNYPDSSDFLIRNRKIAYRNDTLCIVFVDAITTLEDNTLGPRRDGVFYVEEERRMEIYNNAILRKEWILSYCN